MSFLNATAKMTHASRLPLGTTRAQALAMLSDHEFFLTCDPHLSKYERLQPADLAKLSLPPSVPENVRSRLRSQPSKGSGDPASDKQWGGEGGVVVPTCYRVTDIVHAIPAGIWDTNVVSDYEFTDITDGLFVRIRSPLGVMMDTFWEVRETTEAEEGGGGGGLELVEDVTIQCSRLLVGIVKGQCENGWGKIHGKMIARLEGS